MLKGVWIGWALAAALAVPAMTAGKVQLTIRDGRVWLTAEHATIAEILAEWSRVGATQMLDTERIKSAPLTLDLRDVPEMDALEAIMRSAGGFVVLSRTTGVDAAHASRFSRVVVVPSANAGGTPVAAPTPRVPVAAPAVPVPPVFTGSGGQRLIGPDGQPVPDDQEDGPPPPRPSPPVTVPGGSMPPGFSEPPRAAPPAGAPRPGMIPPAPPPRRPGGATSR